MKYILIICLTLLASAAIAQNLGIVNFGTGGAGSVVPVGPCSNQLDFSQACNSQYIGTF